MFNPVSQDFDLAKVMLTHSLAIKPREKVLITASELEALPLAKAVFVEALKLGAFPLLDVGVSLAYQYYTLADDWQLQYVPEEVLNAKIDWADAYVRIFADDNPRDLNQIDPTKLTARAKLLRPIFDKIIDSDRWVLTQVPTSAMAQEAGVSLEWLREFYYKSVLVDYDKMKEELSALEAILDKGKEVHVTGERTDLRFSIEPRLALACYGERNIPDGEVFMAPVHDSIEGTIYFDFPTLAYGREVRGVYLEFEKGKVTKAKADIGEEDLNKILDTDNGARYVGEFAIGANYNITNGMKNTLFDEKIGGTIHMALGRAYREKRGGGENESAIHWDIVKDMRKKGHRVEVDGVVILDAGKIKT